MNTNEQRRNKRITKDISKLQAVPRSPHQGSQVLQQMPDPQKSSEMAFQMSFGSRNWPDVLEYVLDTNAYLEKQFLNIFHQQKRSFVGAARSRVEKRIFSAYHLLQEVPQKKY